MSERTPHPGQILSERFLKPLEITPYRLAKSINVPLNRITAILKGERRITPDTAIRLGYFFGVDAAVWLEMQMAFELSAFRGEALSCLEDIEPFQPPRGTVIYSKGVHKSRPQQAPVRSTSTLKFSDAMRERLKQLPERKPDERELTAVDYGNGFRGFESRPVKS